MGSVYGNLDSGRPQAHSFHVQGAATRSFQRILRAALQIRFFKNTRAKNLSTAFQETTNNIASDITYIQDGVAGNYEVVQRMIRLIRSSVFLDKGLADFTANLLTENHLDAHSETLEIFHRLFNFIKDNVRYIQDVGGRIEKIKDARTTIQDGYGDCDDHAIANATLLAILGYEPKIALAKYSNDDSNYQHVYCVCYVNGERFVFDTTLENASLNKEVPAAVVQEIGVFDFVEGVDDLRGAVNGAREMFRQTGRNAADMISAVGSVLPVGLVPSYILQTGAAMLGKAGKPLTDLSPENLSQLGSEVNGALHDIIIKLQNGNVAVEIAREQAKSAAAKIYWLDATTRATDDFKYIEKNIQSKLNYINNYGAYDSNAVTLDTSAMAYLGIAAVVVVGLWYFGNK